jgi:WD40 repeat protein
VTDQANKKIAVFDAENSDWNQGELWSWQPTTENGFSSDKGWIYPSDVKFRTNTIYDGQVMLTCASGGFCGMVSYPSGKRIWSIALDGHNNPHAVELLPNGNIAVAASDGGWVRIYTASQGADSSVYAEADLHQAHGVLWDPEKELLWAVGNSYLTAFQITGTPEEPVIEELKEYRSTLPLKGGHDLMVVYGNSDRLWVTSNGGVFQYEKSSQKWFFDFEGSELIQAKSVKSVGNQPNNAYVIRTIPNNTFQVWNTNTVELISNEKIEKRTHDTGAYYKARIWYDQYQ